MSTTKPTATVCIAATVAAAIAATSLGGALRAARGLKVAVGCLAAWRAGALSTTTTVATPATAGVAATVALSAFGLANACQHFSACGLSSGWPQAG